MASKTHERTTGEQHNFVSVSVCVSCCYVGRMGDFYMFVPRDPLSHNPSISTIHTQKHFGFLVGKCSKMSVPFTGRYNASVVTSYLHSTSKLYVCDFTSSPTSSCLEALTAWHCNGNQIAADDCAFPSTQPVNAFIVTAIVQDLTIGVSSSYMSANAMLSSTFSQPSLQ